MISFGFRHLDGLRPQKNLEIATARRSEAPSTWLFLRLLSGRARPDGEILENHYGFNPFAALAALKTPVDAFFDQVMVNAEDAALRDNRLALLQSLHSAMNRVADLSRLNQG